MLAEDLKGSPEIESETVAPIHLMPVVGQQLSFPLLKQKNEFDQNASLIFLGTTQATTFLK